MSETDSIRKASSLMSMIAAVLVMWTGIYIINSVTRTFDITAETFHTSAVMLGAFLLLFFAYMLYKGIISESIIAILIFVSLCSFSVVYMIEGKEPENMFGIIVSLTGLIPLALISFDRERLGLSLGGLMVLIGSTIKDNTSDDAMIVLSGALMIVGGIMFALYSAYEMYKSVNKVEFFKERRRALNPAATCETMGYLMLGFALIFGLVLQNAEGNDLLLPETMVITASAIAMTIALFSAVNGSISSGTTILMVSSYLVLLTVTELENDAELAGNIGFIICIPLIFTAYRFFRKHDILLMTVSIASVATIIAVSLDHIHDLEWIDTPIDALFVIDAALIIYAAFSRTVFIETGKKLLPLFDGGSFNNDEEKWNDPFPDYDKRNSSLALQSFLMASIGLMLMGTHLINRIYDFTEVNELLFDYAVLIISVFMMLFAADNFRKCRIAETVAVVSTSVFMMSYALCGIYAIPYITELDIVPAICMAVAGSVFFLHRNHAIGTAFILAASAIMISVLSDDDIVVSLSGAMMVAAGAIVMVLYTVVKLTKKVPNPSISERRPDAEPISTVVFAKILGMILLGLVLVMISLGGENDLKSVIISTVLSALAAVVSVYGLAKDDAPDFIVMFATSLIVFIQDVCFLTVPEVTFDFIMMVFSMAIIPVIAVFAKRGNTVSAAIATFLFLALLTRVLTDWTQVTDALFFIAGITISLHAVYHWALMEKVIGPVTAPNVSWFLYGGKKGSQQ